LFSKEEKTSHDRPGYSATTIKVEKWKITFDSRNHAKTHIDFYTYYRHYRPLVLQIEKLAIDLLYPKESRLNSDAASVTHGHVVITMASAPVPSAKPAAVTPPQASHALRRLPSSSSSTACATAACMTLQRALRSAATPCAHRQRQGQTTKTQVKRRAK